MEDKEEARKRLFSRLSPAPTAHLRPLSVYSRMISCGQKTHLRQSSPKINLKIEINNCGVKRKLDDSHPDDLYNTPKKAFHSNPLSPDLGCFVDCSITPVRQDESKMVQTVRSQLVDAKPVEHGSTEPETNVFFVPHCLNPGMALLRDGPVFDGDVDEILCLDVRKASSSTIQPKPVLSPESKGGEGQVKKEEQMKKEMPLNVKDVEDDNGYFSMSYIKDKTGKDPSRSLDSHLPETNSPPLLRLGQVEVPEPSCHAQAALSGQRVSFVVGGLRSVVSGSLLESELSPGEPLESDVEELWNIGLPLFESSVCHNVGVKFAVGCEQSSQASDKVDSIQECRATLGGESTTAPVQVNPVVIPIEEAAAAISRKSGSHSFKCGQNAWSLRPVSVNRHINGNAGTGHNVAVKFDVGCEQSSRVSDKVDSILECQDTLGGESTADTSFETTAPLQVQVKSVVVVPNKEASQTFKFEPSARSLRPLMDLEREKRLYVQSVTRHMNENAGAGQDAVTELRNLMSHVADQKGTSWQHPSDLTSRNHQKRFGNLVPTMTLLEWQAKNDIAHERFARVPKIFERSQFF